MNKEAKEMMKQYLEDMKNVTPEQDDYLARHHIALEYSRILEEEEAREEEIQKDVEYWQWIEEHRKKSEDAQEKIDAQKYEFSKSSTRNILLGIGAVVAGVLGCYAISKSSSGDGYTYLEDSSFDYNDYNCNNYYNDDLGCDWY